MNTDDWTVKNSWRLTHIEILSKRLLKCDHFPFHSINGNNVFLIKGAPRSRQKNSRHENSSSRRFQFAYILFQNDITRNALKCSKMLEHTVQQLTVCINLTVRIYLDLPLKSEYYCFQLAKYLFKAYPYSTQILTDCNDCDYRMYSRQTLQHQGHGAGEKQHGLAMVLCNEPF